ncbi:ATP-binding cassette domain-containing protein [Nocardioides jishulii]|uniref:ABC transporter ATP-binding protein n=1 Tax=Nocardioides jishulii TaxID=2575440 RepID=A0A4U2YN89_9ACTN|nr:ABC transporter ATP-binding protein [Nocardioides jishulii]QCX27923.1 ABC transporter ATP-binding protein [Nocardioides jishulii]TKI62729.1 ABC transporter ATP-binding protein [Nocardioides jishulii]
MSLVEISDVVKTFAARQRGADPVQALKGVSLSVDEGETVAIIGESGSGKSTLGKAALRLIDVDSGSIVVDGDDLGSLDARRMRAKRADMQVVFQEPFESLNPRLAIGSIIAEPLQIHRPDLGTTEIRRQVVQTMERVGLPEASANRLPGELSGGQQQRVGIARAVISRPKFLVLDEPTSSLDLSIRAQVLALLAELQQESRMAYLFVSHDMHTVEWISDRIAVMYLGEVVETAPTRQLFDAPTHAYTRTLLSARLSADPRDRHAYKAFAGDATVRQTSSEAST